MVDIVISIAAKVAELLVEPITKRIRYAFNYKDNLRKLKDEVDWLINAQGSVNHRVEEAARAGEKIEDGVDKWLKRVQTATKEANKVIGDGDRAQKSKCFIGLCPDFKTRYQVSRNAEEHNETCVKLRIDGHFDRVSYYQPPEHVVSVKDYEGFESRAIVLEAIVEALTNADVNLVGVYGLGGVGKTTLVKKLAEHVKEHRLFKVVVMAAVTQNPDLRKIQGEIGDRLDFKFGDAETVPGRGDRLRRRLLKEKEKVLIILDDLWARIDLEELGIPYGKDQKGCKILMTSRFQHVLSREMHTDKDFLLQVLEDGEAWNLFQTMVGDAVKDPNLQSIAPQVAKRCAGLPILLVVVASALKDRDLYAWDDALERLRRFDSNDFNEQVFSALELSYNFLRGEEIKSLFLLFAEFGNPNFISIQDLLMMGFGLGIFKELKTLEKVRNRLMALLDDLKASCLLLEGDNNRSVKMHDVVHNFAVSVASRDHHAFIVPSDTILTDWPPQDIFERCTSIVLSYCKIPKLPEVLECPNLESYTLENIDPSLEIPDDFFARTKKLKVLDFTMIHFHSLPSSVKCLVNLRTLCFYSCQLNNIDIIGELKELQVLCFLGSNIVQLPKGISELTSLQLINLKDCLELEVIPPDVLPRLNQLEELCMENSFVKWDCAGSEIQWNNANLEELKHLSKLSTLDIHIPDAKMLQKDLFPAMLRRFRIFIGDGWNWVGKFEASRTLKLKLNTSIKSAEGIEELLKITEDLYLDNLLGVKNVLFELDTQGFPHMKHLCIQNSPDIQHVVNSTRIGPCVAFSRLESLFLGNLNCLEKICHGQLGTRSFNKLKSLDVRNCGKMRNLFSFSIAKWVLGLEEIKVIDCESMEEIVVQGSEVDSNNNEPLKLTQLRTLTLQYLPQFTSFCSQLKTTSKLEMKKNMSESKEIVAESEIGTPMPLFNHKVICPNLAEVELTSIKVEKIWCDQIVEMSSYVKKLTTLKVVGCQNLKYVFTPSMLASLAQLKNLDIYDCNFMEDIITTTKGLGGGELMRKVLFPKLAWLELRILPELKQFCSGDLIECPNLTSLWIKNCPKLKAFISDSLSTNMEDIGGIEMINSTLFDQKVGFPKLESLRIYSIPTLNMIWHVEFRANSFSKLRELRLSNCQDLSFIFPHNMLLRLQSLMDLTVIECGSLEKVFDLRNIEETHSTTTIQSRNLRSVLIQSCVKLKTLFPIFVAASLVKLEELKIQNCILLEEIVAKDEVVPGGPMLVFPQLKHLELSWLLKLRSFYPGLHCLHCPMLETLNVHHCHELQTFDSEFYHPQEIHEEKQQFELQDHQFPLFSSTEVISKLKMLSVNSKDATMICHDQFLANFLDKIKILQLSCFHEEDQIFDFPFDLLLKFQNMERFIVRGCCFEELFPCGVAGEEKFVRTLSQIKYLELQYLPSLRHIWNQEALPDLLLPNLSTLIVRQCNGLTNLAPSTASFQTLTTLEVWWCNGLINLVTSSTAKTLVQLTEIKVYECDKLTEIVEDIERDETENEIVFSKLESLTLKSLPSFISFYSGSCIIKFPSLQQVIVEECPKMEIFSRGPLSTPKLQTICLTEVKDKQRWKGDLNATVKQLYADMNAQQSREE